MANWTDNGTGDGDLNGRSFTTGTGTWTVTDGASQMETASGLFRTSSSDYRTAYPADAVGSSDCTAQAVRTTGSDAAGPALINASDGNQGYFLANRRIYEFTSSGAAGSILDTAASNPADGSTLKIAREGNDIVGYDDTVEFVRATDTTYMTLVPGIRGLVNLTLDDIDLTGDVSGVTTYTIVSSAASVIITT